MKMTEVGGREILIEKNKNGYTALHYACEYKASTEVIMKLIELGGRQLVMEKYGFGWSALHIACRKKNSIEVIVKLIEVGGRELTMEKDKFGVSAFHVACKQEAPAEVIVKLANFYDDFGEPIKEKVIVAIQAMAMYQQCSVTQITARYGLHWSIMEELLVESNVDEAINGHDSTTGLRLFMVAAMGDGGVMSRDLSSIYGLMRMSPCLRHETSMKQV